MVPFDRHAGSCRVVPFADRLYVFDNSGPQGPLLIARKDGAQLELLLPGCLPEIDAVLATVAPQPP